MAINSHAKKVAYITLAGLTALTGTILFLAHVEPVQDDFEIIVSGNAKFNQQCLKTAMDSHYPKRVEVSRRSTYYHIDTHVHSPLNPQVTAKLSVSAEPDGRLAVSSEWTGEVDRAFFLEVEHYTNTLVSRVSQSCGLSKWKADCSSRVTYATCPSPTGSDQ